MSKGRRIVVVGATSGIAEHCTRQWAAQGNLQEIVLLGRNADKLQRQCADLQVRAGKDVKITPMTADFLDPARIQALVDEIARAGAIDIVLIAHGMLPDQAQCQQDLSRTREAIEINAISPVLFAEAFVNAMLPQKRGTVAIIGSVAGDRGRKSNYVYGAAKGLVSRHAEGLQHRLAGTGLHVLLIKPGPTDTPMTASLKQSGAKLASPEDVATDILNAIEQRKAVIYTPRKWALIMLIIRNLPRIVFHKLNI
ncbi:MAG: SDR family NAD(P)-dependent oxidoreductase [Lautropia sp.]|nr:SDR family NAD(P)-dependent oxidoreductase [Lautropia sp.]